MFKDENRHYSLRKLSVGLASVLIGISFASSMNGNSVKADTVKSDSNGVAETKNATTSETNKVDANVDLSKEIAKSTNSVDSNKITPSQTVLNKQTTSNDELLKGTEVKQEQVVEPKQETPGKQAPVNEQPTVSNKNANINLNSNLNKQDLANSLLKDTNKPEITNTFHVRKLNIQANVNALSESKAVDPNTNGGFDSSWGKLDVNDWKGNVQGDYYQLTDYTGDANHIIVPNEADFAKAGISTSGKQVGVTSSFMHTIFKDKATATDVTVAFSKTDNKQVKAIGTDWHNTWKHDSYRGAKAELSKFDGTNLDVSNVTNMNSMFQDNEISDLSSLADWKVDNVTDMNIMFADNQISNLGPLASWKVDHVTDMSGTFMDNQISDISPLANWRVNHVKHMLLIFDGNISSIKTNTVQAKRVINFVYPADYTGKKQGPVTQTVDLPQKVKIELTTKFPKPSNNILDWVTKTETPEAPDPVYFQDYTVPEIKGLLEPDKTVISREQADITTPISVTVTYKLVDSNTNDAFALDSKHGLHEHANVNDNGGYDADFWGKINVDDWNYMVNGDRIEINGLKDGISTGANDAVIVPNLDDFKLAGKDGGAKTVYISNDALGINAKHKYYGLSKTNGNTFTTNSDLSLVFYKNNNLTHADLNSLNTSNVTNMNYMFSNTKSLTGLDVSNWDTGNVTNMTAMFIGASSLTNLDASKWNTSNVTNMGRIFTNARSLTNLDVSHWDTSKVTDMHAMFYNASSLTSLDVSHWDTSKVTNMRYMFDGAHSLTNLNVSDWDTSKVTNMRDMFNGAGSLALIVNGDKFADYLAKNNFADSRINSGVKSVTTDNTKLLQVLTNDGQHDSATRTIVLTFPANYSPDLAKYHLTKNGNTYQIKQSADYDKPYLQGTVLINATEDITKHHIDTTKRYKLSDTWQPNYNKLILAHKNSDGSVSFDAIQLPKVPGYKAVAKTVANPFNPARALFAVSFMALPKPVTPVQNDAKPAKTVTPVTPAVIEVAKPIKTEPKVTTTLKVIDLSDDAVSTTPKETTWQVANNLEHDIYHVSNGKYTVELPHISNAQLHVIANDSTKDSVLFTYKGQNTKYVFNIKFANGHYLLSTYEIKSGKLVKLIDYNFIKSSKMIDTILDWLKLK